MFLFKPFYVFWQNLSLGLNGIEYRAMAKMLAGIYFNIMTIGNFLIPTSHHIYEKIPYLLIPILMVLYLWLPHYIRINHNHDLEHLDNIGLRNRAIYALIVIVYYILTYRLYTYSN